MFVCQFDAITCADISEAYRSPAYILQLPVDATAGAITDACAHAINASLTGNPNPMNMRPAQAQRSHMSFAPT